MRGNRAIERSQPMPVESVERLVEQPQRRAARHHPRQPRALGLSGRQQPHRHIGQRLKLERREGLTQPRPAPESKRPPQRQFGIKRQPLIGKSRLGALDPPRGRLEQPRNRADQTRLAAAIGAGDVQRIARAKRKVEPLEQGPPAALDRQPLER